MRRYFTLLILLLLINPVAQAEPKPVNPGPAIYTLLLEHNVMENYMLDNVAEIVGNIVQAAGRWSGYRINSPYVDDLINIYLIDSNRLPEKNILEKYDIELAKFNLQGNAMAHEATGTLFIDTLLLKSIVTASQLTSSADFDTIAAVGIIKARGINAFRRLWDPAINTALEESEYTDPWAILASGSVAFILAHEMGHIALGSQDISKRRKLVKFKNKEDKDKHWVCSDLVDEKYRQQQAIEQEADDFAVSLLSKIYFPPGALDKQLLHYELGAQWYLIYNLSEQMIETLYATESQNIHAAMRLQLGPEIYQELKVARPNFGGGSVKVFFPKTHPANIRRASQSLAQLAQSPYSLYYGAEPASNQDIAMFEMFVDMECKNLKAKYEK